MNATPTMVYETGAKTRQANDLVLSVVNDGAVYADRKHVVFAAMQSATHRNITMRQIVETEARKQRARFGSKFSAAHITEATDIVWSQTLAHCLELIVSEWTGENIVARANLWFDKPNGNTYHSVRMWIPSNACSGRIVDIPRQYGYGDQWKHSAVKTLRKIGFTMPDSVRINELPVTWGEAVYVKKSALFDGVYI